MKIGKYSEHLLLCLWLAMPCFSQYSIKRLWKLGLLFNVELKILWTNYYEFRLTLPFLNFEFGLYFGKRYDDKAPLFEFSLTERS